MACGGIILIWLDSNLCAHTQTEFHGAYGKNYKLCGSSSLKYAVPR